MSKTKSTLTFALTAAIGAAGMAHAAGNPFAMQSLDRGYMVAATGERPRKPNAVKASAAARRNKLPDGQPCVRHHCMARDSA